MTFVTPSDDVILQEGTFGFSFIASGAISGAMLVKANGPMYVVKCTAETDNAIGVAANTAAKGDALTVYGPGNIIRSYTASTATAGDDLFVAPTAGFCNAATYGGTYPCVGIALESKGAAGTIRVLLK